MIVKISIPKAAVKALLNVFGEPPDDPEKPITENEWIEACVVRTTERHVGKGQKRLGEPEVKLLGIDADDLVERGQKARKKQADRAEAKRLRKIADEAEARANG